MYGLRRTKLSVLFFVLYFLPLRLQCLIYICLKEMYFLSALTKYCKNSRQKHGSPTYLFFLLFQGLTVTAPA